MLPKKRGEEEAKMGPKVSLRSLWSKAATPSVNITSPAWDPHLCWGRGGERRGGRQIGVPPISIFLPLLLHPFWRSLLTPFFFFCWCDGDTLHYRASKSPPEPSISFHYLQTWEGRKKRSCGENIQNLGNQISFFLCQWQKKQSFKSKLDAGRLCGITNH